MTDIKYMGVINITPNSFSDANKKNQINDLVKFLENNHDRFAYTLSQQAVLELTHNWGTENDEDFSHHDGNSDPRGFGHIGITVPDVYEACERFESLGVEFQKKPDDGNMKGLAFIKDPDGYWIEILSAKGLASTIQSFK